MCLFLAVSWILHFLEYNFSSVGSLMPRSVAFFNPQRSMASMTLWGVPVIKTEARHAHGGSVWPEHISIATGPSKSVPASPSSDFVFAFLFLLIKMDYQVPTHPPPCNISPHTFSFSSVYVGLVWIGWNNWSSGERDRQTIRRLIDYQKGESHLHNPP